MGIGLVLSFVVSRVDYHWFTQRGWIWVGVAAFLLLLCFVPHLGKKINGSVRWLSLAGLTVQPSEFAKLALVFFLSYWLGRHQRRITLLWEGMGVPLLVTGGLMALLVREPDLGSCAIMGLVLCVLLYCSGVKMAYLLPVPLAGLGALILVALAMPERKARLLAFLNPSDLHTLAGKGYQQLQGLIALGSGGVSGLGLGNSRQKMNFLPESTTDFIFPIVGEELGLYISLGVVLAFLILTLCSGWITLHAPDPTGVLLGTGLTTLLAAQSLINLGVVTKLLPNKGMPLPFISYGGSNLLLCLLCIGLLFNLQRQGLYDEENEEPSLLAREKFKGLTIPRLMSKRVLIACGGTGGHLFPGIAVAEELQRRGWEAMLLISRKTIDHQALAGRSDLAATALPSMGWPGVFSPRLPRFVHELWQGHEACAQIFRTFRPQAVLGMGGFISAVPLWIGRRQHLPILVHESNVIPGKVTRLMSRTAGTGPAGFWPLRLLSFPGHLRGHRHPGPPGPAATRPRRGSSGSGPDPGPPDHSDHGRKPGSQRPE